MSELDRINWDAAILNGQPCIRGSRLTVRRVVQATATCLDRQGLYRECPELDEEDLQQALAFASKNPGLPLN